MHFCCRHDWYKVVRFALLVTLADWGRHLRVITLVIFRIAVQIFLERFRCIVLTFFVDIFFARGDTNGFGIQWIFTALFLVIRLPESLRLSFAHRYERSLTDGAQNGIECRHGIVFGPVQLDVQSVVPLIDIARVVQRRRVGIRITFVDRVKPQKRIQKDVQTVLISV